MKMRMQITFALVTLLSWGLLLPAHGMGHVFKGNSILATHGSNLVEQLSKALRIDGKVLGTWPVSNLAPLLNAAGRQYGIPNAGDMFVAGDTAVLELLGRPVPGEPVPSNSIISAYAPIRVDLERVLTFADGSVQAWSNFLGMKTIPVPIYAPIATNFIDRDQLVAQFQAGDAQRIADEKARDEARKQAFSLLQSSILDDAARKALLDALAKPAANTSSTPPVVIPVAPVATAGGLTNIFSGTIFNPRAAGAVAQ